MGAFWERATGKEHQAILNALFKSIEALGKIMERDEPRKSFRVLFE
jgi:hypothetical protein